MFSKDDQSIGGKIMAERQKQEAYDRYMLNSIICLECHNPIIPNPEQKIQDVKRKQFCNHTCSAKYNNVRKVTKEMKNPRKCLGCDNIHYYHSKSDFCKDCRKTNTLEYYGNKATINDFNTTAARHKHQGVRNHAHRVAKKLQLEPKCKICNYDTYVELCHIKAISSFKPETKLSIVNAIDNLCFLCPNHHKELDLGLIIL